MKFVISPSHWWRRLCVVLLLSFGTTLVAAEDGIKWESFTLKNGHIQFPITLNGTETFAMIDSGAETNAISEYFVDQHRDELSFGDKVRLQGVFGTEEKRFVRQVTVGMFGATLTLKDIIPATLGGPGLLLGAAFINHAIIQIDYANQRIRLLKHEWIDLDKLANVELRRQKGSRLPAFKVQLSEEEDSEVWLTLDTGNAGGIFLPRSFAEQRGWLKDRETVTSLGLGATGFAEVETFTLPYLKVGPYELENIQVTVPAEGEKTNVGQRDRTRRLDTGAQARGLLGYDVLKHFVLTLDNKNLKAHLGLPEVTKEKAGAATE